MFGSSLIYLMHNLYASSLIREALAAAHTHTRQARAEMISASGSSH